MLPLHPATPNPLSRVDVHVDGDQNTKIQGFREKMIVIKILSMILGNRVMVLTS